MKYKITISEITEKEVPKTDYKNTGKKDEKGNPIYDYIETGKTEISRDERNVYEQEVENLDIGELAIYINRAKLKGRAKNKSKKI